MESLIDSGFMINHHQNFFHVPQKSVIIYFLTNFFLGTIPSDISIFSATDVKRKKQMPRRSNFRLNEPHKPSPNQPDDFSALGTATPHSKT